MGHHQGLTAVWLRCGQRYTITSRMRPENPPRVRQDEGMNDDELARSRAIGALSHAVSKTAFPVDGLSGK